MNEPQKGVLAMIAACVIWGLSPLYYKLVGHVPPLEVLSHRTLWSLVLFGAVLAWQRRLVELFGILVQPRALLLVVVAAVMISINWFVYIWAIQVGRTVESSLGYYLFPLVAVLLGLLLFGEKLSWWKWVSLALAGIAGVTLALGLGVTPWISLILAVTFAFYGAVKKVTGTGPVISVTAEVLVLAPLALIWLYGVHVEGWLGLTARSGGIFASSWRDSLTLILSGPITAGPLILYSYAARRVTLSTIGVVQYLNPTLQFFCATVLFGEVFTGWHLIAFSLIWVALAIYSADSIAQDRAARKSRARAALSAANDR